MKKKNILLLGVGALLAVAATVFFIRKNKSGSEKPPKKAPQVPVDNPGEQSEFTTTASESELG